MGRVGHACPGIARFRHVSLDDSFATSEAARQEANTKMTFPWKREIAAHFIMILLLTYATRRIPARQDISELSAEIWRFQHIICEFR